MEAKLEQEYIKEIKVGVKHVIECCGFNHEGQGICKIKGLRDEEIFENFPLFVDELVTGEKGIVEITKLNKTYGYAKVTTLFKETRPVTHIVPKCKIASICGGCNIMHMSYDLQLKFKQQMVNETLTKIGKLEGIDVLPTIGMKKPFEYRNKVQVPFRKNGYKTICGFFERDSHKVVPFDVCHLQPEVSSQIVNFVRNLCNEYRITGYNESDNSGLIRHVLVKSNHKMDQIMVVLVLTDEKLPEEQNIVKKLTARYPSITSIVKNINSQKSNTILGNKSITIYGNNTITDELCGLKFEIGTRSFYQVNHDQTEVLYNTAISLAGLNKTDVVIDAYCGIGTIGLIASKYVKEVYSVEVVDEAIKNAIINAKNNNIENIHFVCNKAENQIQEWIEAGLKPDAIFVDPPRKGCDLSLLETIVETKIKKIVYVSCDPATLARDLAYFTTNDYQIKTVQPVDMFPQTSHIETVVCLQRK